jgi:hypothetical protein
MFWANTTLSQISESIDYFIEGQAFSHSNDIWLLAHLLPIPLSRRPATHRKTEKERQLGDGRGGEGRGEEPKESAVLSKSFNII